MAIVTYLSIHHHHHHQQQQQQHQHLLPVLCYNRLSIQMQALAREWRQYDQRDRNMEKE